MLLTNIVEILMKTRAGISEILDIFTTSNENDPKYQELRSNGYRPVYNENGKLVYVSSPYKGSVEDDNFRTILWSSYIEHPSQYTLTGFYNQVQAMGIITREEDIQVQGYEFYQDIVYLEHLSRLYREKSAAKLDAEYHQMIKMAIYAKKNNLCIDVENLEIQKVSRSNLSASQLKATHKSIDLLDNMEDVGVSIFSVLDEQSGLSDYDLFWQQSSKSFACGTRENGEWFLNIEVPKIELKDKVLSQLASFNTTDDLRQQFINHITMDHGDGALREAELYYGLKLEQGEILTENNIDDWRIGYNQWIYKRKIDPKDVFQEDPTLTLNPKPKPSSFLSKNSPMEEGSYVKESDEEKNKWEKRLKNQQLFDQQNKDQGQNKGQVPTTSFVQKLSKETEADPVLVTKEACEKQLSSLFECMTKINSKEKEYCCCVIMSKYTQSSYMTEKMHRVLLINMLNHLYGDSNPIVFEKWGNDSKVNLQNVIENIVDYSLSKEDSQSKALVQNLAIHITAEKELFVLLNIERAIAKIAKSKQYDVNALYGVYLAIEGSIKDHLSPPSRSSLVS
jgi:hypothetical protein